MKKYLNELQKEKEILENNARYDEAKGLLIAMNVISNIYQKDLQNKLYKSQCKLQMDNFIQNLYYTFQSKNN